MRVRDWTGADHYRALGVKPTATRDEITAAYRARARLLHPDTGPVDPAAEEQFVRVSAAYRILTGPQREEYDRARRRGQVGPGAVAPATIAPAPVRSPGIRPWHLSRRGAKGAVWGGLALVLAGILAALVVTGLMRRDARLRSEGVLVSATVVREGGEPRLEFTTESGRTVTTDLPDAKSGGISAGDTVAVRYDRDDPTRVVTEHRTVGRDITLWIVAAKLLVVGTILAIVGARRLLRPDA